MTEVFSEPSPNRIESSEGYFVEVLGRAGLRYGESGRTTFIDSELLVPGEGIYASRGSLTRWDPSSGLSIAAEERERILGNIQRAFEACGHKIQIG